MDMEKDEKFAEETTEVDAEVVETKEANKEAKSEKSGDIEIDANTTRKIIFSLCYLWGILFFIPLIMYKNDAKAMRHANEGLVLLLFSVIGNVIFGCLSLIPVLNIIFGIISAIYSVALLVLGIIGIVYVVTDQDKELPLIGQIKLLK